MIVMNKPLVSVVIPLFNKEKYIEATIQSVVNQTYSEIELVVIDDASTDGSYHVLHEYLRSHSGRFRNVTVETRANTGQTGARNEGVLQSKGEFVSFLDADDVWHPEKIEEQVRYLTVHNEKSLVFCNYLMIFENISKTKAVRLSPIEKKITSWLLTVGYGGLLESTGMARRLSLLQMGGFESNLQMCGGLDLAYRFKNIGEVGCVDEYLCGYRITKDGWHNNKSDLIQSYESLLLKSDLYGEYEAKVRRCLEIHLCLWSCRNRFEFTSVANLLIQFLKNPFIFSTYVFATTIRVLLATVQGILLREESLSMRERMSCH
jgi:glycosyltransferase involved in cell wall biosynthesis